MRFHRKGKEHKAKETAYRRESREHTWVLYILISLAALLSVYYFFTNGALSVETYAALLFLVIGTALVADLLHKRNLKMLKLIVFVFCASLIGGALVGGLSHAVQPAYAYTFANGQITSSDGKITTIIPYVTPPNVSGAALSCTGSNGPICQIAQLGAGATTLTLTWLEDTIANLVIDVVNAVIYIVNLVIVVVVDSVGAVITIPVYLFDTISITTLGPVVDFLSFIPTAYAWIASVVVWAIALTEWIIIIIAIVRLMRVAIGSAAGVLETTEESTDEDIGELS